MSNQNQKEQPAAAPALSPEQFAQFLQTFGLTQSEAANKLGEIAESVKKQRPENVFHPDVSAYNPLGERDNPRPDLRCEKVWFGGFPVEKQLCSLDEILLLNQLEPGEYIVTRVDDQTEIVPVEFIKSGTGKLARINIGIKTGDEHRNVWPSMKKVLAEIVSQIPKTAAA